ncbi:MAG: hypothetical protein H0T42_26035 [Deltaproteobacteria bacterium]|nr:hypothetical protein [Deltaproteobacteria bacterium]
MLRSFTLGLLGACAWMLAILVARSEPQWCPAPRAPAPAAVVANPITVIDLASASPGAWRVRDVADMVRLAPGEEIVAVNDRPAVVSWGCSRAPHDCAGAVLARGRYVEGLASEMTAEQVADFTVASATASRRVLVLIH